MSNSDVCYYSVLGVRKHSTDDEIRCAYRKMALKWHPDRWIKEPKLALEAKKRFQHIQQAYSVLSNKGKRMIYDAGIFGLIDDDDEDDEGFVNFMQEMASMMQKVRPLQGEKGVLEDLQGMLMNMMAESEATGKSGLSLSSSTNPRKKTRIL